MQNKNPQGNFDPIPDSDQELEKYGVWVKAEPQDLVEEPETEHQPLAVEDARSIETTEELSGEIEDLEEILDFDEAGDETFEKLDSFDDEDQSALETGNEESETMYLSDLELEEPEKAEVDDQSFDDIDLEMDLDESLSTDTVSDDDTAFDFELSEETSPSFDLDDLEPINTDPDSIDSNPATLDEDAAPEDLLPGIEMETIEMEDEFTTQPFDDIGALEKDLASSTPASTPSESTVSSDLLQKIALELSSIKEELVSLRSQLGELKREPVPPVMEDDEAEEDGTKGGFFDDEDDDTIALTGDELDNILNTADFTVEPPEDLTTPDILDEADVFGNPELPDGNGASEADWLEESQDLLPEDGSYLPTEPAETTEDEDFSEPLEPGIEAIEGSESLDLGFEGENEPSPLDLVPEINVITESPEDTSYLDGEASELSEGFELDAIPLEEVPLMEPDLTELDLGSEIDDAIAAESAEDLPFMESADVDEGELILEADDGELILDEEPDTITGQMASEDAFETSEREQIKSGDDDFDSILELDEADDEIVLSIDGDEQQDAFDNADFIQSMDEVEEVEPLSMDPFEDETISELELHKEGPRQSDGSWSSEPEDILELEESMETDTQASLVSELVPEPIEDFESMDFESEGLLGSQEVEDLGGEDLDVLEEIEELSEVEEIDTGSMVDDLEMVEEELPAEEPEATPTTGISEDPDVPAIQESAEVVPDKLKQDVKSVLLYLDQLLASLPEEKIEEFASSEYYDTYKKLFEDLGLL
jgi:hypothetical protein